MENDDEEFPRSGGQAKPIGNTLKTLASTLTTQRKSSETSGSETGGPKPTGRRHGGTAVSVWQPMVDAVQTATTEAEAKQALDHMLTQLFGRSIEWKHKVSFGGDGQFDTELEAAYLPRSERSELVRAWDALAPLCEPAIHDRKACAEIGADLARLFSVTPVGKSAYGSENLAVDTMLNDLCEYPADCVRRALTVARRGDRWRPSLSQIIDDVRWRARPRSALRAAFREAGII